jgi:hypothetical protein
VTGNEKGCLDIYSPFEFEDKASSISFKDSKLKSCYIMNRICHPDEGAIIECRNKVLEAEREHCIIYCTQKGYMHIYDIRARNPVFDFNFGLRYGCISAMTLGPRPDQALVGTIDGSLITYDFRYNAQVCKSHYTKKAGITKIQSFYPNKYRKYFFNNANYMSPLAFISTTDGQISLIDLSERDGDIKESQLLLVSRNAGSRDSGVGCFKQKFCNSWNSEMSSASLMSMTNSSAHMSMLGYQKQRKTIQSLLKNVDPNSSSALLCPKHCKFKYSASFLLQGDYSGRLRYWDIQKDSTNRFHFYQGEDETIKYRKSKVENAVHIIRDRIETSKVAREDKKINDFGMDLEPHYFNDLKFPKHAHTDKINALDMLYYTNEQG